MSVIRVESPISGMRLWAGKYMGACMYVYLFLPRPLQSAPSCRSCRHPVVCGSQSSSEPDVPMQLLLVLTGGLIDCLINAYDCGLPIYPVERSRNKLLAVKMYSWGAYSKLSGYQSIK